MTTTTNNPAPVEQCDRQAFKQLRGMFGPTVEAAVDRGEYDDDWQMQLLANHRLRATGGEASRIRSEVDGIDRAAEAIWRAEWAEGYEPTETWPAIVAEEPDRAEAYRVQARAAAAALRPAAAEERSAEEVSREAAIRSTEKINAWVGKALASASEAQQPTPSEERSAVKVLRCCYGHTEQFAGCEDCPYVFGAYAAAPEQQPTPSVDVANLGPEMTDEQIKHMVNRFLSWKLPENFNPDGGVSFKRMFNENTPHPMKAEPYGTNLFDAVQADAMVRHMVEGMLLSTPAPTTTAEQGEIALLRKMVDADIAREGHMASTMVRAGLLADLLDTLSQAAAERPRAERGDAFMQVEAACRGAEERGVPWVYVHHTADLRTVLSALASADQAKALTPPAAEEGK